VFGGAAIYEALFVDTAIVDAANQNVATALFELLTAFPLADVTVLLAVFLVAIFFVTSCDSGSLVMDILTSGGYLHSPVVQRAFWAILSGVVAAVLVLVLMAWGLLKAFREDMPAMSHRAAVAMHRREDGDDE
jgi:choline/glycine/proline betaine transport protein